ncbi:MAG TPA: glycosyltransferase family 1 protein [Kiritimatiellia bacterium]|nr:glycosyltransferase family 1 protein [Kiritimatiellia bacterium]
MKVAVNLLFLIPGEVGGSETYVCETLRALAGTEPGVALHLVANRENYEFLRHRYSAHPHVVVHLLHVRAANRYARIIAEQTALPRLVKRLGADVLWSPGYTMPAVASCPQVVSILDMQYRTHPDDLSLVARWTTHALVSMAVRRAAHILAISEFSRDEIVRETGVAAERLQVTPLGVDPRFGEDVGDARRVDARRRFLGADSPFFLSVAHSYPHKNLPLLVNAFRLAAGDMPHRLLLIGKPRRGEPALQQALAAAPAGRVHRINGVSRDDLIALYQAADAFVFPSLYEGFGLPLLEAMQAGTPVLATGEGSTREVGGDACRYADGRDPGAWAAALLDLARMKPATRRQLTQAGRTRAAQFLWERTASLTLAALRSARSTS